jgi:hypothetical protein
MLLVSEFSLSTAHLNTSIKIEYSPSSSISDLNLLLTYLGLLPFILSLLYLFLQSQIVISAEIQALVQITFLLNAIGYLASHI